MEEKKIKGERRSRCFTLCAKNEMFSGFKCFILKSDTFYHIVGMEETGTRPQTF